MKTMNEHSDNDIINFISNVKCGLCGRHPGLGNINFSGRLVNSLFFTTYCPSCNNLGVANFNIRGNKETETATDLTEAKKSHFIEPIGSSDTQGIRRFLRNFQGDFAALFANYG